MKLTDQSPMPFGKFQGQPMESVNADYLLWLWDEAQLWNRESIEGESYNVKGQLSNRHEKLHVEKRLAVHDYIRENFATLETECPDRIITHRP